MKPTNKSATGKKIKKNLKGAMLCVCCVALFGQIGKIRNVSNVKVFVFVFVFVCFFVKAASLPFVQTEARLQRKSDGRSSELIAQAFLLCGRKIFKAFLLSGRKIPKLFF